MAHDEWGHSSTNLPAHLLSVTVSVPDRKYGQFCCNRGCDFVFVEVILKLHKWVYIFLKAL